MTRVLDAHANRAGCAQDRAEHEQRVGGAAEDARPIRVCKDPTCAREERCELAPKTDCSERVAVGKVGVRSARERAPAAAHPRYFFGDYCTGEVWSLRVDAGKATDVRREPITIRGLSTFGEDARGELYAGSVDTGRVYKLVP